MRSEAITEITANCIGAPAFCLHRFPVLMRSCTHTYADVRHRSRGCALVVVSIRLSSEVMLCIDHAGHSHVRIILHKLNNYKDAYLILQKQCLCRPIFTL